MLAKALPVSETKTRFSELAKSAALGLEIISVNRHSSSQLISLIKTDILTAALKTMKFSISEEWDEELGVVTISVDEIPIYGEGNTQQEAINSLVDAAIEYTSVYQEKIDLFSRTDSPMVQAFMVKLIRAGEDRQAVQEALGICQ